MIFHFPYKNKPESLILINNKINFDISLNFSRKKLA